MFRNFYLYKLCLKIISFVYKLDYVLFNLQSFSILINTIYTTFYLLFTNLT